MKATTIEYKTGMVEPFRRRSHLEIRWLNGGTTESWLDSDIVTATVTDEVDPLARKLPQQSITFGIIDRAGDYDPSNPTGKWARMDEGLDIAVRFGFDVNGVTEWLSWEGYTLDGKPTYSRRIATFRASSRISQMNKTTFYKTYANIQYSLAALAETVMQDAGLTSSQWSINAALGTMYTGAPIPIGTHAQTLQRIANAAGCALYERNAKVCIQPVDIDDLTYHTFPVTQRDIVLDSFQSDKSQPLQKVQVQQYAYQADANASELAKVTVTVSGSENIHIEFPEARDVAVSVSSGTVSNRYIYTCATDFVLTATGSVTITVTGKKFNHSVRTVEYVQTVDPTAAVDIVNNPILTSKGTEIGNAEMDYFSHRVADTFSYRGDPAVEALDGIYVQTSAGEVYPAIVVKHAIKYNGALAGSITARRVSETPANAALYGSDLEIVNELDGSVVSVVSNRIYRSDYTAAQMDAFITAVLGV